MFVLYDKIVKTNVGCEAILQQLNKQIKITVFWIAAGSNFDRTELLHVAFFTVQSKFDKLSPKWRKQIALFYCVYMTYRFYGVFTTREKLITKLGGNK